jgi:hypothetical protein
MNKNIFKKLLKISNLLDSRGLLREADLIDGLIKSAVPLVEIQEMPRSPGQPTVQDRIMPGGYWDKPEQWYGALEAVGSNIILIPFEASKLDEEDLYKMLAIWRVSGDDYSDLKQEVGMMSSDIGSAKGGDLDRLKELFPDIWGKIKMKLNQLDIDEDDAVYIFYNEDNSPSRGLFFPEKSPKYLAHDIGHHEFDFGEDYEFKYIIFSFLRQALSFYISSKGIEELDELNAYIKGQNPLQPELPFEGLATAEESAKETKEEIMKESSLYGALQSGGYGYGDEVDDDELEKFINEFFDTYSTDTDHVADVFGNSLAGDPRYSRPNSIWHKKDDYIFLDEKEGEMKSIEETMLQKIKNYVSSKSFGPLSSDKGNVLLYDI